MRVSLCNQKVLQVSNTLPSRICVDTGRACSLLLTSPLAASQNFEYKMSNILDKPLEVRGPPITSDFQPTDISFPSHQLERLRLYFRPSWSLQCLPIQGFAERSQRPGAACQLLQRGGYAWRNHGGGIVRKEHVPC